MNVSYERALILIILILAFITRFIGVGFGLPDLYHADEPIVVNHALAYGAGDFNPHFFKIPPLVSYLLFVCFGIYFIVGKIFGRFSSSEDFVSLFLTDPTSFYFLGRFVFGVVLGTVTIYVLYRLLRKFFSTKVVLLSAFFLAASFLHVRDSHYVYADIPLVFLLVLCFFPILEILNGGGRKYYILFGFLAGLAVATKYNGVLIFAPFFLSHLLVQSGSSFRAKISSFNLFISCLISFFTFISLNPFAVLDFQTFIQEVKTQAQAEGPTGFLHHLSYSLNGGLGLPLFLCAVGGIFSSIMKFRKNLGVLLSFVMVYYFILAIKSQPYDRYVLPLLPFLVVFAAHFLVAVQERFKLSRITFLCLVGFAVLPSLLKVYFSDRLFVEKDVRTIAREWIEQKIPEDSKIAIDTPFFTPRLKLSVKQLEEKQLEFKKDTGRAQQRRLTLLLKDAKENKVPRYQLYFLSADRSHNGFLFSKPSIPYDLNELRRRGIQYVVTCQIREGSNHTFYQALETEGKLLVRFTPYRDQLREWPFDQYGLTGGPFLWRELTGRKANGQVIQLYELTK